MGTSLLKLIVGIVLLGLLFTAAPTKTAQASLADIETKTKLSLKDKLRQAIGQKLMIDVRYFCPSSEQGAGSGKKCRTPMTQLPVEVAQTISQLQLGGVILFSENLQSSDQIRQLTSDLNHASRSSLPLFIATDQEGGRVARLPKSEFEAFSGNMPLGAIYSGDKQQGRKFTQSVYEQLAISLRSVGINVNFAPNIDVNNNPNNPVINIRSFSDEPSVVSELGLLAVQAMQQQKVMATLKHFPGHGDTKVDSHTGLPKVEHSIARMQQIELLPYQQIFNQTQSAFVMSAHIQFPALDNSTLMTKNGERIVTPATFSKPILTDLLRHKLGYQGLIITDALDMRAVSDSFTPTQAVANAFNAGADIALMPMVVDSVAALYELSAMVEELVDMTLQGALSHKQILASFNRIKQTKSDYLQAKQAEQANRAAQAVQVEQVDTTNKMFSASPVVNKQTQHNLAKTVAEQSIVIIDQKSAFTQKQTTADESRATSVSRAVLSSHGRALLVMPDSGKCQALLSGLAKQLSAGHVCWTATDLARELKKPEQLKQQVKKYEAVVVASLTPKQSAYEMVGVSNTEKRESRTLSTNQVHQSNKALLKLAREANRKTAMVSLRAPYDIGKYNGLADMFFVTMSYGTALYDNTLKENVKDYTKENVKEITEGKPHSSSHTLASATFDALAKALFGQIKNNAKMPVNIDSV